MIRSVLLLFLTLESIFCLSLQTGLVVQETKPSLKDTFGKLKQTFLKFQENFSQNSLIEETSFLETSLLTKHQKLPIKLPKLFPRIEENFPGTIFETVTIAYRDVAHCLAVVFIFFSFCAFLTGPLGRTSKSIAWGVRKGIVMLAFGILFYICGELGLLSIFLILILVAAGFMIPLTLLIIESLINLILMIFIFILNSIINMQIVNLILLAFVIGGNIYAEL
eukprot:c15605_g1_i1.p1 GENE.c15605_g1_i1~~c15605_g1_i1.p1  ORF type:complete len:222 (+),score=62.77 c15605_g1_i1:65-730(+)